MWDVDVLNISTRDKVPSPPNPQGHFCTSIVLAPKKLKLSFRLRSKESTSVKTEIIAKMPMVTPNNDSMVRSIFIFNAFHANRKLSRISFVIIFISMGKIIGWK